MIVDDVGTLSYTFILVAKADRFIFILVRTFYNTDLPYYRFSFCLDLLEHLEASHDRRVDIDRVVRLA